MMFSAYAKSDEHLRHQGQPLARWRRGLFQMKHSTTRNFADPAFDGDPAFATQEEIDANGKTTKTEILTAENAEDAEKQADELHDETAPYCTLSASTGERDGVRCRIVSQQAAFFNYFKPEAQEILNELLEKYATDGELKFVLPDVLKVPPISQHGSVGEIVDVFGGPDELRTAANRLQELLYAP
jgi:hypothetical protein